MAGTMDLEEIDSWYEEKKEALAEKYKKSLAQGKNSEKAKKEFEKSFARLHKKYENISDKGIKKELKSHFFWHRVAMIKKKIYAPFEQIFEKWKKPKQD